MENKDYPIENILKNLKIDALNEMQIASLEANRKHNEVILLSSTGSGKTLSYLLPILENLEKINTTQAIIIVPSRELAQQIEQVFKMMGTGLKITACYGGHMRETEENNLVQPPAVIVGTPGRLADHIRRGSITTRSVTFLVLDEFDKSLELGFEEEMAFIIASLPAVRKKILTSATDTAEMPEFLQLDRPEKINFIGEPSARLSVKTVDSSIKDKTETLFQLICHLGGKSSIVFCNHREAVERTSNYLKNKGVVNEFYHGAMEQPERDSALCKFRNGSTNVLVTTDLASRGLDIPGIQHIIHYHLPHTEEIYTHRNGRTARMNATGNVILILSPEDQLPDYVTGEVASIALPENLSLPDKPRWTTLFIAAGKKDKVNKVDIVGFLANKGLLKKDDIGLIEVKDFTSYVAIRTTKFKEALELMRNEKIKNKKVKMELAK